ncbi:MAG: hypothetical protein JWQ75_355, partial [Pseudarthrobacter sp.]|nr:hypothetical protein [Pseudarthrobacter sp.]
YLGWQWYAVLTRNSRSKVVTVNELGLLPSEESILAPEWVPWAERVRPEDAQEAEAEENRGRGPEAAADVLDGLEAGEPEALEPDAEALDAEEPDAGEPDAEAHDAGASDGGASSGEESNDEAADDEAFDDDGQDLEDPRSEREAD